MSGCTALRPAVHAVRRTAARRPQYLAAQRSTREQAPSCVRSFSGFFPGFAPPAPGQHQHQHQAAPPRGAVPLPYITEVTVGFHSPCRV